MQLLNLYQRWAPVPACTALCVPSAASLRSICHKSSTEVPAPTKHCHVHCPSSIPSWGHHRARAERITSCSSAAGWKSICLQECLFLWPSLTTKCKMQSCYCPRHPLAAPVSSPHALSSRDSLLLILFCKWASANFHSVRTSKFYVCNSWLVKRK